VLVAEVVVILVVVVGMHGVAEVVGPAIGPELGLPTLRQPSILVALETSITLRESVSVEKARRELRLVMAAL
jgi:hypothetical protein